jgi:hypothetical protein
MPIDHTKKIRDEMWTRAEANVPALDNSVPLFKYTDMARGRSRYSEGSGCYKKHLCAHHVFTCACVPTRMHFLLTLTPLPHLFAVSLLPRH